MATTSVDVEESGARSRPWRSVIGAAVVVLLLSAALAGAVAATALPIAVSGVARAAGGSPVAGLRVFFSNANGSSEVFTGPEGGYTTPVAGGSTNVTFEGNGATNSAEPLPSTFRQTTIVSISSSLTIDIALP